MCNLWDKFLKSSPHLKAGGRPEPCEPLNVNFRKSCRVAPGLERYSHHALGANLFACMCENILRDERESGTQTIQRYHFSMGQRGLRGQGEVESAGLSHVTSGAWGIDDVRQWMKKERKHASPIVAWKQNSHYTSFIVVYFSMRNRA